MTYSQEQYDSLLAVCKSYRQDYEKAQSEIERLNEENKRFERNMRSVLEIEKKQAIKEFAEKLKERAYTNNYCEDIIRNAAVDELLKEYEK